MEHFIVYAEAGRFAGWPANNGLWAWGGREILVGFTAGDFREQAGHNIREPYRSMLARSVDGGRTWRTEEPANFVGRCGAVRPAPGDVDLAGDGFALRVVGTGYHGSDCAGGAFFASQDRGRTWQGPFSLGGLTDAEPLGGMEITARTDYLVGEAGQCLVMMSVRPAGGPMERDCVFCARMADGGRRFRFVSWLVPPSDPFRAVMPSTVRLGTGVLVAAVRRRGPAGTGCWIDAFRCNDDGVTWRPAGKVADTGSWNGNPPALVRLADGRVCCVFGDRAACHIVAAYSADGGVTWGGRTVLRDDFQPDRHGDPDLGYPRAALRSDGRLVAIYYWATRQLPQQHIAATIWEPRESRA